MRKSFIVLTLSLISFTSLVFVIFSAFSSMLPQVRGFLYTDINSYGRQPYPEVYESYEFRETVKDINITSTDLTVSIHGTDSEYIAMVLTGTGPSSQIPEYSVACSGGTLSLEMSEKSYDAVLDLYLPLTVKFSSLNIQNIYSPVNLYTLNISDININSIFGDVYAYSIYNVSSFKATTLTGQIHIADCTAVSLECESDSGTIVIESGAENLTVKNKSGRIQFSSDHFFRKADLRTESGDIELIFPPDSSFEISYFNRYGSVIYKDFVLTADGNILACTSDSSVPVPINIKTDYGNVYIYSSSP